MTRPHNTSQAESKPSGSLKRAHRTMIGGLALVLPLVVTGCGDEEEPSAQQSPGTSTSSTPTPVPSSTAPPAPKTPKAKALAQLRKYLQVRDEAWRSADADPKQVNKLATGQEYLAFQQNVSAIKRSGSKVTGQYVHTLGKPRRRGETIFIVDCEDRSGVKRTKDGKPIPDTKDPEGNPLRNPVPIEYRLVKERGRWLVESAELFWKRSC